MAVHTATAKNIPALPGHPEASRGFERLHGLFARLQGRVGYWRRYRETATELDRLSDDQLADIGIRRANIAAVARSAARAASA